MKIWFYKASCCLWGCIRVAFVISTSLFSKWIFGLCFQHRNLTTGNNLLWKRGEIAPNEQLFLNFHNIFNISLTSGIKWHIRLWNMFFFFYFFLQFCKSDTSRYGYLEVLQRILGIWNNESRLYFTYHRLTLYDRVCVQCWKKKRKTIYCTRKANKLDIYSIFFNPFTSSRHFYPNSLDRSFPILFPKARCLVSYYYYYYYYGL